MKLVFGVGVNDADYVVEPMVSGKRITCPAYDSWKSMLRRSYSAKSHARYPTYIGTEVCEEWKSFTAFRSWWVTNHVDGFALDKDLIGVGKLYSPECCVFVPRWLNNFVADRGAARGDLPIGVSWHRQAGKYRARCNHPFGKKEYLGLFSLPEQAHQAWLSRKLEIAAELKPMMDEINVRIYPGVIEIIRSAK